MQTLGLVVYEKQMPVDEYGLRTEGFMVLKLRYFEIA